MPFLSVLTACLGSLGGPGRLLHLLYESEAETVGSIPGPLASLYQDVWVSWLDRADVGSIKRLPDCWLSPLWLHVLDQFFRIELIPSTPVGLRLCTDPQTWAYLGLRTFWV